MIQSPDYNDGGEDEGVSSTAVQHFDALAGAGERIDRFLAKVLAPVSRTRIQRWFELGAVTVEGRAVLPRRKLSGFERIEVTPIPHEAESAFAPDPVDFQIIHEDSHLMVVDKPVGLVVHPAAGHWRQTLMNGLLHARPDSARLPRAGIVHRLDKDTSGLMLVARSERAFDSLTRMMTERSIRRTYLALCHGALRQPQTLERPIGRDPRHRQRMAVLEDGRGRDARTHINPLFVSDSLSLVCCRLDTGRTHQIRVHLASIGHPLLADRLYGGSPNDSIDRQALHAFALGLTHPESGETIQFRSALPADMAAVVSGLGLSESVLSDEVNRLLKAVGGRP
jgi:23S rRNA pseudouridine1911/1915/1917 synthase